METLNYSSNELSQLNEARRQLWSSKYMLGCANKEPEKYEGKAFWMRAINRDRAALIKVARALRAKLPAKKLYRIAIAGSVSEFAVWEWAHTAGKAKAAALDLYGEHFHVCEPELIK